MLMVAVSLSDGPPIDGVAPNSTVSVHVATSTVFITLAAAGIIFTLACLVFNFYYRNKK